MFKHYLRLASRNFRKGKIYSLLNIIGLATGMAVAVLIGFWVWDEISFNRYHKNYDQLAQVMVVASKGSDIFGGSTTSMPMATAMKEQYGSDFKAVSHVSFNQPHILSVGDKQIIQNGSWAEQPFPDMLSLRMLSGNKDALADPSSILISESVATALFGDSDPLKQSIKIDNSKTMAVAGVYEDIPANSQFADLKLLLPWTRYVNDTEYWIKEAQTDWANHMCQAYVELADNTDINSINEKIRSIPTPHIDFAKEELVLQPMSEWHLYDKFSNGQWVAGRLATVKLFAVVGLLVLLLACINFMNLSTAKSEKRGKDIAIQKTIGSTRRQLILQFLSESILTAAIALVLALIMVKIGLPYFNSLADKDLSVPWQNGYFWLLILGFTLLTGAIAGSYPAFYLSSFSPIKVFRHKFIPGRFAGLPRKILVVFQFTVSVALMICTAVVYRQIQHAANRPVGYAREGLIKVDINSPELVDHYDALRNDLLQSGLVADMAETNSATTKVWSNNVVDWDGKDPSVLVSPGTIAVSHDYGNTIGWKILEGRDFSREFPTDTFSFILNETAVKMTGFKDPVGKIIRWDGQDHKVIGVVKDMVMESPYQPIRPVIFHLNPFWSRMVIVRLKPNLSAKQAIAGIEPIFKKHNPGSPFAYSFVDDDYAEKFSDEQRIGSLTSVFSILAFFISCLGLFGLTAFVGEQRIKEIGIRKTLGASIVGIWRLLSKDFMLLVVISCVIAVPLAWYFLNDWLQQFQYRTQLSWWIFALAAAVAIALALITVSWQAIKNAQINPVKSLRSE